MSPLSFLVGMETPVSLTLQIIQDYNTFTQTHMVCCIESYLLRCGSSSCPARPVGIRLPQGISKARVAAKRDAGSTPTAKRTSTLEELLCLLPQMALKTS